MPSTVCVIGAGFAGLSAAKTLTAQSECQVIVLEASSAVGGRARGGQLPSGTQVELGATWFHGVRDNPVYDMAVWQGVVKDIRCDPEHQKHDSDWQLHFARPLEPTLLSGELNAVAMEAVGRYTEAAEECTQGAQIGDGTVGDVLRRTFDEAVASEKLEGANLQIFADAWHFREKLQRTFDGFFSTDDVSLAFAREYETLEGPNMPVPGGYQALAEILAQGLDIRYNHRVSRISYGPSGATVTCENGSIFEAQHVLVTTSLGVLQTQHQKIFDPPLPQWKLDAMAAVRIGVADKLFVEFEIQPQRARDAAVWLSTHANLALTPSPTYAAGPSPSAAVPQASPQPTTQSLVHTSVSAAAASDSAYPVQQPRTRSSPGNPRQQTAMSPQASPPRLPHDVEAALPPESTGGLPEPFNLGRRPIPQLWSPDCTLSGAPGLLSVSEDSSASGATVLHTNGPALLYTAAAAAAAAAAALAQSQQGPERPSTTGRNRRRKHKRTIHSYAFLWPVSRPVSLGTHGHPALLPTPINALTTPICLDPLDQPPTSFTVPAWLQGLHSIRYCPGPEWIEPSLLQEAMGGSDVSRGKRTLADAGRRSPGVNLLDGGATHVSGVLWITGQSALEMERASDEEVTQGVATLFRLFPQVPIPPGAIMPPKIIRTDWGTNPNFMGSYSYVNVTEETGDVVDAIAEPLCNDQGVPIVLFAGEATYRQYIGTIHGAFLSGCREAERLLEMVRPQPIGQTTSSSAVQGSCSPTRMPDSALQGDRAYAETTSAHLGSLHV